MGEKIALHGRVYTDCVWCTGEKSYGELELLGIARNHAETRSLFPSC